MAEGNGEAVTSPQGRAALFAPSPSSARLGEGASERRESNPRSQLGKLMYCLCTTLARPAAWPTMLAPTLSGGLLRRVSLAARLYPNTVPAAHSAWQDDSAKGSFTSQTRDIRRKQSEALPKGSMHTWQSPGKRVLSFPEREPAACSVERI